MRTIEQKKKTAVYSDTVHICCIESEYEDAIYIDSVLKSNKRYIITDVRPVTKVIAVPQGFKQIDVIEELKESSFTDDHQTKLVRTDIHDFNTIMHTLIVIIETELKMGNRVILSISTGSGEFCAAASILGMSYEGVHIVNKRVWERECEVSVTPGSSIKRSYSTSYTMEVIEGLDIDLPDQNLIVALSIFNDTPPSERKSQNIIKKLLKNGVWFDLKKIEKPIDGKSGTSLAIETDIRGKKKKVLTEDETRIIYNEKNFYQRNILGNWVKNGWVKKDYGSPSGYKMTDLGVRIISMFVGKEDEFSISPFTNEYKDEEKRQEQERKNMEYAAKIEQIRQRNKEENNAQ